MPTAVLDLDLKRLPREIKGLDGYSKAFTLCRIGQKPVGSTMLPVINGVIRTEEVYEELLDTAGHHLATGWLEDFCEKSGLPAESRSYSLVTIAICTRNRTADLKECLDALSRLPDDVQEILVIDNCPSTNDTQNLVAGYSGVRYVCELKPGLNNARNRALAEATHDIVAFTDDDARPDAGWLRALAPHFDHPLVGAVTGLTLPAELETEAQEVFETFSSFSKGFQRKTYDADSGSPLTSGRIGAGANMALRKSVLQTVGPFDAALDAGTPTQSGGDHEYFFRLLKKGHRIVYEPEALSWHRHSRTGKELQATLKGYGTGVYAFWTKALIVDKEFSVFRFSYSWFIHEQLPNLIKAVLQRPNTKPFTLILYELAGCIAGPWAYLRSRRQ